MSRVAMLAKVHIAKKEMRLDDDTYRALLKRTVGKSSAGDCTDRELSRLLAEFRKSGWTQKHKRPLSEKANVRKVYALWGEIRALLDGKAGDAELRSFVSRQTRDNAVPDGVSAPEFCNAEQTNRVIEGLKGWLERLRGAETGESA